MTYLHYLIDNEEKLVRQTVYSNSPNRKLSMEVMDGEGFIYKIYNRITEEHIQ